MLSANFNIGLLLHPLTYPLPPTPLHAHQPCIPSTDIFYISGLVHLCLIFKCLLISNLGWITLHWLPTTFYLRFMLTTSYISGSLGSVLELVLRDYFLLDLSWMKDNLTAAGPAQEIDVLETQASA